MSIKVVQVIMRHSTITLTADRYGHLIRGAETRAIEATADMTAVDIGAGQLIAQASGECA